MSITRLVLVLAASACLFGCGTSAATQVASAPPAVVVPAGAQDGIDRQGEDYKDFDLAEAKAELCRDACLAQAECTAWTFVRPGFQGDKPRCWLKKGVPTPRPDPCCVSGVKTGAGSTMEK